MMVDSERGMGRPERALELGRSVPRASLPVPVQVELAIALLRKGKEKEGTAALDAALKIDPAQPEALYIAADLALGRDSEGTRGKSPEEDEKRRAGEAQKLLNQLVASKHDGYAIRMKMANIALAVADFGAARAAFEAASEADPTQSEPIAGLIKIHRKLHDERSEMAAMRRYVLLEQHDRGAWGRLLELLVERNEWEEAVKVGESAMFVDLENPEIHRLYARALAKTGRPVSAIFEYNSALIAGAPPDMAAGIYAELAKGYEKLGETKMADEARRLAAKMEKKAPKAGPKKKRGAPGDGEE